MNTTFSTVLLAALSVFMFSLSCFGQDNGPRMSSVLERDSNSLGDWDPGMESMLLTPVEDSDSDVEVHASSAGPDNEWKKFRREMYCTRLKRELERAREAEADAWQDVQIVILDKDSSMGDLKLALRRWESAFKAVTKALNAWNRSGCGR